MYYSSFKKMYENEGVSPNGLKYKYFVKTYVCDVVEIDRKDIVYWSEKASFQKKEVLELIKILEFVHTCLSDNGFYLDQAKTYEFGDALFCKANVVFYKDKSLAISDGKSGRVVVDSKHELNSLIKLLSQAVMEEN